MQFFLVSHLRLVGRDEKVNLKLGLPCCSFLARWSIGHFGSRSHLIPSRLFKSSCSPLGPGNMAHWGDRRGGGHDHRGGGWGGGDQWTGGRSGGGGGGGAHNPYEVQLPCFLSTVIQHTDQTDWSSIMMVDKRDDRLVSPFQAWLVSEIMANSASSINVLTERDQVMPPSSGFHMSLFANYTLDGIKVVLAVSLDSTTGSMRGGWDPPTARALAHPAFQPFSWPMLRETSASYTDLKIYNGNEILFHWVFRGFRADTDLTVQQQFVDEVLVRDVHRGKPRLSCVVAVFVGWRVTVMSFECGGRTYAVGPKGSVVAGDHARSRWEIRVCNRASDEAVGNDADRVEFRFRDANNRLDLKCARTSVPGTWLTVSHISGPTLIRTIQDVRSARARVEGPEQTEQFAQLAAVHQDWWTARVASSQEEVGARVEFVGDLEQGNFHVIAMSSLLARMSEVVPIGALAEMQHDRVVRPAPLGPLALTGDAWLHAAEDVERAATPRSSGDQIAVTDRTSRELDLRSFAHGLPGTSGHVVDEDRDLTRRDRRFARSTAQLTPELFANMVEKRWFNESTATIEEMDQPGIQDDHKIGQTTLQVPQSTPFSVTTSSPGAAASEPAQGTTQVTGAVQSPAAAPEALGPKPGQ